MNKQIKQMMDNVLSAVPKGNDGLIILIDEKNVSTLRIGDESNVVAAIFEVMQENDTVREMIHSAVIIQLALQDDMRAEFLKELQINVEEELLSKGLRFTDKSIN